MLKGITPEQCEERFTYKNTRLSDGLLEKAHAFLIINRQDRRIQLIKGIVARPGEFGLLNFNFHITWLIRLGNRRFLADLAMMEQFQQGLVEGTHAGWAVLFHDLGNLVVFAFVDQIADQALI